MSCFLGKKKKRRKEKSSFLVFYSWILIRFNGNIAQNEIKFGLYFKPALQFSSLTVLAKCLSSIGTSEKNLK